MAVQKKRKGIPIVILSVLLLAAGAGLFGISRLRPEMAQWYAQHIYPGLVSVFGRISGIFSFSVAEILAYILIAALLVSIIRLLVKLVRREGSARYAVIFGSRVLFMVSVLFFLYVINCGVNYSRVSFSESAGIQVETYTKADLKRVCQMLTDDVVWYAKEVNRDKDGVAVLYENVNKEAIAAMHLLGESYPEMEGYYPRAKGLLTSQFLSVQNLSGIYIPVTIEANYNADMTDYNIPFTICHELSHLRGFMQEEEANFIAYLACMGSKDSMFRYSGSMLGWIYCTNVLQKVDNEAYQELRAQLPEVVEADLRANRKFWAKYDGKAAEVSNMINDTYLKANGQQDGVESYDRMVDLIVAVKK